MSAPAVFNRLALIGMGLMGSSIARAARAQGVANSIVGTARSPADEGEPFPEAEMRMAAEEFFRAVRFLLDLDSGPGVTTQDSSSSVSTPTT